jgi:hypothetical protein
MNDWLNRLPLWATILLIVVVWAIGSYVLHQAGIIDFWYWRPD